MRLRGTALFLRLFVVVISSAATSAALQAQGLEPITQTRVERTEETVYREEFVTEMRESQQLYYTPVTEYVWQPRVHGVLNPFRPNTLAYHLVPCTRWEARPHTVRTPITARQLRPETRIVERPVRELGFAERPQGNSVVLAPNDDGARVAARHHALPSAAPAAAPATAGGTSTGSTIIIPAPAAAIGGVSQMDGDHPRFGASSLRY
jgi:hypothetical protein